MSASARHSVVRIEACHEGVRLVLNAWMRRLEAEMIVLGDGMEGLRES